MALTDISFEAGDGEVFLSELPTGALNAPSDIVVKYSETQPITEVTGSSTSGNIFIMSE